MEHPCVDLNQILSSGTFYYSVDFDLTNRLQDRFSEESAFDVDSLDEDYLWNSYMIDPLIKFRARLEANERKALDASRILTSAIRGFVLTITIPPPASPIKEPKTHLPSSLTLISRLSCRRAGTRFNARGIDDDGNTANFVETEIILRHPSGRCFSYAQIRGSVPVFWEQATGLLPGQQKIQLTRSPQATQPAFNKHFESLDADYGSVHVLNLLSESKPGEAELTARYRYHIQHSPLNQVLDMSGTTDNRLSESQFDFHAETKGPGGYEAASLVRRLIQRRAATFAYFSCEDSGANGEKAFSPAMLLQQDGIFRTNCLDCLDRTNLIQTIISQMALELFLTQHANADFWVRHSSLWADNGDALSKIYAGTGALKSSFTRHGRMSLAGAIADARKSATRLYINNFADKARQNTIDMLLGRLMGQTPVLLYDPIGDYVNSELKKKQIEFTTNDTVQIYVGTFNLNGRGDGLKEDLTAWLCPQLDHLQHHPEIVVVGFQEMVELSPQQIMATDPVRRQAWENAVRRTLNDNALKHSSEEYILLRSGQLVGAALMVFCTETALARVKNVEGSVKKTGMSGMAGNKGAVAVRMDYANTRLCFVTAHLAAGFANFEERNRDFRTINQGLHFQRNRLIEDHDAIIWAGDFNYRIGLGDDKVRRLCHAGDLESLYQNDQLNLQMVAGQTFPFYSEKKIMFAPTYKYNNGTDDYDTSEKARIPAWCDRVLRKGDNLKQISYLTAPLRFSDHRPVYATFQCTVSVVDEMRKEKLSKEIYARRRLDLEETATDAKSDDLDEEDLIGYDSIAPELPPASSDRRKWWLDNGLPARSGMKPPGRAAILNSQRPDNPFTSTDEPDWLVMMPEGTDKQNTAGSQVLPKNLDTPNAGQSLPPRIADDSAANRGHGVLSRPKGSSRRSTTSSTTNIARKPAPPIPKKPEVLSQLSDHRIGPDNEAMSCSNSKLTQSIQGLHGVASNKLSTPNPQMIGKGKAFPYPGQDTRSEKLEPASMGPQTNQVKHREPHRRDHTGTRGLAALMDTDNEGATLIPALKPQRKG